MRIGLGVDVHAFAAPSEGRPLILGGVHLAYPQGLAGHSDADVLVHAVMDALLGAARLGDIGKHFPPTDAAFKDACSLDLLRQTKGMLDQAGWRIHDIDCVIIAEQPRLSPYRDDMRARLAGVLEIEIEQVGIKATTTERLGFEGRGEGITAQAVALLERLEEQEHLCSRD